jgi:hypothetical protein
VKLSTKVGLSFILAGFLIPFLGQVIIGEAFAPVGRVLFPVLLVACGVTVAVLIYRERMRK